METFPLMQDNSVTWRSPHPRVTSNKKSFEFIMGLEHSPHPRVTSTKKSFEFKTGPGHSPYPRVTSNKKRF